MSVWRNNTVMMPLLVGQWLAGITHRESDLMGRHRDLQRARVVVAPMNRKTCAIKMSVTNDEVYIEVKSHIRKCMQDGLPKMWVICWWIEDWDYNKIIICNR